MILPLPRQALQLRSMVKKPWVALTLPWPAQVGQVSALWPGSAPEPAQASQASMVGTWISAERPLKASSSEISRL